MASPPKALQWLPHVPVVWRLYPPTSSHTSLPVRPLRPHFGPSPLCLCGHRALVHAVPSAKDASTLPSTCARHHPSDLNYSLPPYIMYLVTPVISGPLRRVFGGEASKELPRVCHSQGLGSVSPPPREETSPPVSGPQGSFFRISPLLTTHGHLSASQWCFPPSTLHTQLRAL